MLVGRAAGKLSDREKIFYLFVSSCRWPYEQGALEVALPIHFPAVILPETVHSRHETRRQSRRGCSSSRLTVVKTPCCNHPKPDSEAPPPPSPFPTVAVFVLYPNVTLYTGAIEKGYNDQLRAQSKPNR
ncbi:hypothetical protein UY3_06913 [Chelonia mydas]|uniref:Uncharacterized protein n=1 Tax=Chelonia mydas TaxID=8469 RepID=M7C5Z5_CHEMY|nr:hypothetical protein UY3_06913 [Chelonia mydas]